MAAPNVNGRLHLTGVPQKPPAYFHIQKGVLSSSVTMLKLNIIYKWCLVKYNNSCLKCLKLSAQVTAEYIVFLQDSVFVYLHS